MKSSKGVIAASCLVIAERLYRVRHGGAQGRGEGRLDGGDAVTTGSGCALPGARRA